LVRVETHLGTESMVFYAFRRREPDSQLLLRCVPYRLLAREFQG